MIDVLTTIWERALQSTPIASDDNFFELGGDPASANRLFAEIKRELGRELSPLTIYQAPTISALGAILEQPAFPRFRTLVRLKEGAGAPPIFIGHGVGGTLVELFQFVKRIDTGRPIYGLQTPGLDGVSEPLGRVEDLAQYFLDPLRAVQPHGPYILLGHSFGGLVALEMAQRLNDSGERVALLGLIESYPFRSYAPLGQKASIATRSAKRIVSKSLRRLGFKSFVGENADSSSLDRPEFGEKFTPIMLHAALASNLAWRRYRPRYYRGRINFVRSQAVLSWLPDDPSAVWAALADEFVIETVSGNHYDILTTHSRALALSISRQLEKVPSCE